MTVELNDENIFTNGVDKLLIITMYADQLGIEGFNAIYLTGDKQGQCYERGSIRRKAGLIYGLEQEGFKRINEWE